MEQSFPDNGIHSVADFEQQINIYTKSKATIILLPVDVGALTLTRESSDKYPLAK